MPGMIDKAVFITVGFPLKLLQASLSLRNDVELSFHHGGGPVMLVQACFNAGKV